MVLRVLDTLDYCEKYVGFGTNKTGIKLVGCVWIKIERCTQMYGIFDVGIMEEVFSVIQPWFCKFLCDNLLRIGHYL